MTWAALTLGLVLLSVAGLVATMRSISQSTDEDRHYRLQVRFWGGLAVLGALLIGMFAPQLHGFPWRHSQLGLLSVGLVSVPLVVVMAAGLRNGLILAFACRRRARALRDGITVTGRVVDRSRRVLAQDIMIAVVEADVPRPTVSPDLSYRRRDPECTRRCRFTETCPGDHWARFEPGTEVTLKYDPTDLRNFAVLLF